MAAFSDIETHWAKSCIQTLADRAIVQGYPDGTFRPEAEVTRAELAALMTVAFPTAPAVRPPVSFPDVPADFWAAQVIAWSYARGFFSGYPDGTFQPNQLIPRMQVIAVLMSTQTVDHPMVPRDLLTLYFDDAAEVPDWAADAVADAVAGDRVVNYPTVWSLRPNQPATRGDVAALLCRTLDLGAVVPVQYATWYWGIYSLRGAVTVPFAAWRGSCRLMRDIQVLLVPFRLYPGELINGRYNWQTEQGLTQFCNFYGLATMQTGVLDAEFARALLMADPVGFILATAGDRSQIYRDYLQQEAGHDATKLAFLDRGIANSPYQDAVQDYPNRLRLIPDGKYVVSGSRAPTASLYPAIGTQPTIEGGLEFLHSDIKQACVCIGSFVEDRVWGHWLGRDALSAVQQWSTTKILPLLHVICRANAMQPSAKARDCLVRSIGGSDGYGLYNLAIDLVDYGHRIGSSNSIAAMFKQFATPAQLEGWVQQITGHAGTEFQGRYGEEPLLYAPSLHHQPSQETLLSAPSTSHMGNNAISAYDLVRFVTLLGWHSSLSPAAQLPAAQWSSLEMVVRAMGMDTARYLDVAIDRLGLNTVIESPVIISKLGFGRSSQRDRTELCYVALVQFVDTRPRKRNQPGILRTVGLSLLAAKDLNDANEEARQLDARMAAEVTELLRLIAREELL